MRFYICLLFVVTLAACQSQKETATGQEATHAIAALYQEENKPFYHGVASGDPLSDRVVIWTRVTPDAAAEKIDVKWEVAENERFDPVLHSGMVETSPARDYTVKVDVGNLQADRYYYYRFTALDETSEVGRTKTLPAGAVDSLTFAAVSCSNWPTGYFNAYHGIAAREVDAVLHLGDYIYEYGGRDPKIPERTHLPPHEIVTLSDYRTRYSQYHLDEGLRKMRQRHPIITIWDDHEVANNTYAEGAQNHQPEEEGAFAARKAAAKQAYYEWIPIREAENLYRAFSFGDLAELIMLDERLEGKTKPAEGVDDPNYPDEDRSMLGKEQLRWFESTLRESDGRWKVIGNQVTFSDLDRSAIRPNNPRNMDSWDGYPAEKKRLADFIRQNDLKNIIFLTGDTHASWAFEVVADPLQQKKTGPYEAVAVEFGTPSVSSSNSNESNPDDTVKMWEQGYMRSNSHLKYVNLRDHGYVILTLTEDDARADWFYVETLLKPDLTETKGKTLVVDVNSTALD